ncbi:hypothetical protein Tcan_17575 [Toxocara canis]|uniref:Uncharacterized protein n=1 Tax=Toxocara canis TaxID=6265 RepID=A0A0B2UTL2_TOXCA|nr:hypothetical protein Tcan_17575 [Toxocara canis]
MGNGEGGWKRKARQFLERCRGSSIDEIVDEKRRLLESVLPLWLARYIWILLAYVIFHVKLLHAITQPVHSCLTQGIKSTILDDGGFRRPRFSFSAIRTEAPLMLLTFSALWHYFSMPNPLSLLRWGVTVRPQVNVKPRMSVLTKSSSSPHIGKHRRAAVQRSLSDSRLSIGGKIDLGVDTRISNAMIDPILTTVDSFSESVSLASEFASSMFSGIFTQSSNRSIASQSRMSLISSSIAGSEYTNEVDDEKKQMEEEETLSTAIEFDELSNKEWIDVEDFDDSYMANNSSEPEEKSGSYKEKEIIPEMRWFSWKLPTLWRYSDSNSQKDSDDT